MTSLEEIKEGSSAREESKYRTSEYEKLLEENEALVLARVIAASIEEYK